MAIINGTFNTNLSGWTVVNNGGSITWVNAPMPGCARIDQAGNSCASPYIEQTFVVGSAAISFDWYTFSNSAGGASPPASYYVIVNSVIVRSGGMGTAPNGIYYNGHVNIDVAQYIGSSVTIRFIIGPSFDCGAHPLNNGILWIDNVISTNGNLDISSTPSGASIYIDNVLQTGITTPTIITELSPGTHDIKLTLTNYHDWIGTIDITSGQTTTLSSTLVPLCTSAPKYSGDTVTLQSTPNDGIGPYYVEFRKNGIVISSSRLGGLANPITGAVEGIQITRVYTLNDLDISSASAGTIDFSVYVSDSCPTGAKSCTKICTVTIGCIAPVCNFTVT